MQPLHPNPPINSDAAVQENTSIFSKMTHSEKRTNALFFLIMSVIVYFALEDDTHKKNKK